MCSRRAAWASCALAIACLAASTAARAAEYGVSFAVPDGLPKNLTAGQVFTLPVTVTNTGTRVWERGECETFTEFRVGAHWKGPIEVFDTEDPQKGYQPMRAQIPRAMKQGDSQKVLAFLQAPSVPGSYTVRLDMIWENHTWFEDQGVPLVEMPVEVKAAPATPAVQAVIAWEPLIEPGFEPGKGQRIYVTRTAPCPVTLSFGDGSPNVTLTANQALWVTNFPKVGKFPVTATGTGGCSGSATTTVEVTDNTCPFILPLVKVCDVWSIDCCAIDPEFCSTVFGALDALLNPPHIASDVDGGITHPGAYILLEGDHFGDDPGPNGKVELTMHDFQGKESVVALKVGNQSTEWQSDSILARIPPGLSGFLDQTVNVKVTRSDGKTSNSYPMILVATQVFDIVPAAMVSPSCDNAVSCNQCNDAVDCDSLFGLGGEPFSEEVGTSIVGNHDSIPVFPGLGGGSGTDRYTVHLKNGWHLDAIGPQNKHWGSGTVHIHEVPIGAADFEVAVDFDVPSGDSASYWISLVVKGPAGVPMQ